MKKKNTPVKWPEDQSHASTINFKALEKRVFDAAKMTLGGVPITPQMRDLYREQAKYLLTSNLWEAVEATVINEATTLAFQAGTMEHIEYAKALKYWHTILLKTLAKLST